MGEQLQLFDAADRAIAAREFLGSYRPRIPVEIVFTGNRSTILSVRHRAGRRVLRIQEVFREAPPEVWDSVVSLYLRGVSRSARRSHHAVINRFLTSVEDGIGRPERGGFDPDRLPGPVGRVYDLREILREVREVAVPEEVTVLLTWSERINRRTMGTWHETPPGYPDLIRINRLLDDERVPRLYVASVMHHEVLHEVLRYEVAESGRRVHHTAAFRRRERAFPGYELAEAWSSTHLPRIFSSRMRREKRRRVNPRRKREPAVACGTARGPKTV